MMGHCMISVIPRYYPEGGWGWVVVAAALLTHTLTSGLLLAGGHIIAPATNTRLGLDPGHVTGLLVVAGAACGAQAAAPLTTHLASQHSPRLCAFIGSLVAALGLLFTSFARQAHQVIISYCLVLGLGVSLVQASHAVMIGQYFKKRRLHLEVVLNSWTGLSLSLASVVQHWALRWGGWRLGLQVVAAAASLGVLTSLLLRPASVYHPQRHAILHMRQYMRQVLGPNKLKPGARPLADTLARLRSRSVRVLAAAGALGAVCLLAPLLCGATIARADSGEAESRVLGLQLGLGLAFSVGSYTAGRVCLVPAWTRARLPCVVAVVCCGLGLVTSQTLASPWPRLLLGAALAGAATSSFRVFLYRSARWVTMSTDHCPTPPVCRSHYLAVVSLVSCAQAAPALLSVLLYASCDYGPLWAGVAQLLAGVLMALHCSGLATRKYGTRSATH